MCSREERVGRGADDDGCDYGHDNEVTKYGRYTYIWCLSVVSYDLSHLLSFSTYRCGMLLECLLKDLDR